MTPCVTAPAALSSTVKSVPLTLEKMETSSLFALEEPSEEHSLNIEEIITH